MKKRLLANLTALSLTLSSCVTSGSGGGEAGLVIGGGLLVSSITRSAGEGDEAASTLWCKTVATVRTHLPAASKDKDPTERLVSLATREVSEHGRLAGYRLHPIQARDLILDARTVLTDPSVKDAPTCK